MAIQPFGICILGSFRSIRVGRQGGIHYRGCRRSRVWGRARDAAADRVVTVSCHLSAVVENSVHGMDDKMSEVSLAQQVQVELNIPGR